MKIINLLSPSGGGQGGGLLKISLFLLSSCFCISFLQAQSLDNVLTEIEQNNTVLSALRQQASAEKIGNKTGIYLSNPEVEFHYLWGNKYEIGNRTDISASQNFDFPTAYYHKKKLSDGKNDQVDLKYRIERKDVLLQAKQTCIELIYQLQWTAELEKRQNHARQVADAYQARYDKGDATILDLNKSKFNLLNVQKEMDIAQTEKDRLQAELIRLNGGKEILAPVQDYPSVLPASDFESWYTAMKDNNLLLQYYQQETALSKKNEQLQRSMNLPKFSAGYMSEKVLDEQFQGVTVGVSIPLWENKNTVKRIKAETQAYQATEADASLRFYNETKALFDKSRKLSKILSDYQSGMKVVNSSDLLKKALDAGEISLIDYTVELSVYYEAVNNLLETERDYQLTVAELGQWEL